MSTRLPRKSSRGVEAYCIYILLNLLSKRIGPGAGPLDIISHFNEKPSDIVPVSHQQTGASKRVFAITS
ncbi:conserved protein of unknown function [Citrobacter freundii]|nr:conserved protein of unknown function [Citrobacter freundii]